MAEWAVPPRQTADGDGEREDANDVVQRFRSLGDPRTCCVRMSTLQIDRLYPVVAKNGNNNDVSFRTHNTRWEANGV